MQTLILNHYPPVIKQIKEIQQIAKAEDIEFSKLSAAAKEVIGNMFVYTASETGVQRFEKLLGIKPKVAQSLDNRKIGIISALNRRKMSLTELTILLNNYADVTFKTDYIENIFALEIRNNANADVKLIYKMIDEIVPLNVYTKVVTVTQVKKAGINIKTVCRYGEKIKVKSFLTDKIKTVPQEKLKAYQRSSQTIIIKQKGLEYGVSRSSN